MKILEKHWNMIRQKIIMGGNTVCEIIDFHRNINLYKKKHYFK